ncbi:MAG TPA: branched-chain amino acid ABC transporter permease, partial [Burkholderiaceae bacterium]
VMKFYGFRLDAESLEVWVVALGILAGGALAFEAMRRRFAKAWSDVQVLIEEQIQREVRL